MDRVSAPQPLSADDGPDAGPDRAKAEPLPAPRMAPAPVTNALAAAMAARPAPSAGLAGATSAPPAAKAPAAPLARPSDPPRPPPVMTPQAAATKVAQQPAAPKRRPFEGWGDATARGLAIAGRAIGRTSVLVFGRVRKHGGAALADFQQRRKHSRYRAYALGTFTLLTAGTLLAQLYERNAISAYIRVERVEFPVPSAAVFIRNDSPNRWTHVKITLNHRFVFEPGQINPGHNSQLAVSRFAVPGTSNPIKFAPADTVARHILIECDAGRLESDLQ